MTRAELHDTTRRYLAAGLRGGTAIGRHVGFGEGSVDRGDAPLGDPLRLGADLLRRAAVQTRFLYGK